MPSKLNELVKTINFQYCAYMVFSRIIKDQGQGLLILWGGNPGDVKKVNKSYFLDMVEDFEKGVPPGAVNILPEELQELLQQLEPDQYQCIRVKEDCIVPTGENVYAMPLSIAVPLTIAGAIRRGGTQGFS